MSHASFTYVNVFEARFVKLMLWPVGNLQTHSEILSQIMFLCFKEVTGVCQVESTKMNKVRQQDINLTEAIFNRNDRRTTKQG